MSYEKAVPAEHAEIYQEMVFQFHRDALKMFLDAGHIALFRDMPKGYQVNAYVSGMLIACMLVLLTSVRRDKIDMTMEQFAGAIASARVIAEGMVREAEQEGAFD